MEERRARPRLRRLAGAAAIVVALVATVLVALEIRLSGPTGMSVYVLQRAFRNWVRDVTCTTARSSSLSAAPTQ